MEKPLVSVIIPCFNQGDFLKEAVDSALASTYDNIEIIVINDGSTQNIDFLKNFYAPKTTLIHQENKGVSAARNKGIEKAEGKYILPLDADDKIHPLYIEKAVSVLEEKNEIGIVYCRGEFFGTKKGPWETKQYSFPQCLWQNVIFNSAMYKRSDWKAVGGYKEEMLFGFEDWEFWLSLIEKGAQVHKIQEILFYYRQTGSSRTKKINCNSDNKTKMLKQIIKLHPDLYIDNLESILLPLYGKLKNKTRLTNFLLKTLNFFQ